MRRINLILIFSFTILNNNKILSFCPTNLTSLQKIFNNTNKLIKSLGTFLITLEAFTQNKTIQNFYEKIKGFSKKLFASFKSKNSNYCIDLDFFEYFQELEIFEQSTQDILIQLNNQDLHSPQINQLKSYLLKILNNIQQTKKNLLIEDFEEEANDPIEEYFEEPQIFFDSTF